VRSQKKKESVHSNKRNRASDNEPTPCLSLRRSLEGKKAKNLKRNDLKPYPQ